MQTIGTCNLYLQSFTQIRVKKFTEMGKISTFLLMLYIIYSLTVSFAEIVKIQMCRYYFPYLCIVNTIMGFCNSHITPFYTLERITEICFEYFNILCITCAVMALRNTISCFVCDFIISLSDKV